MCSELLLAALVMKNMQIEKLKESTCRYIALKPHLSSHMSVTFVWPTTLHEHFFWLTLLNSTPKEYVASLRTSSAANLGNAIQSLGRLDLVIKLLAGSWTTHKRMLVLNRSWDIDDINFERCCFTTSNCEHKLSGKDGEATAASGADPSFAPTVGILATKMATNFEQVQVKLGHVLLVFWGIGKVEDSKQTNQNNNEPACS